MRRVVLFLVMHLLLTPSLPPLPPIELLTVTIPSIMHTMEEDWL
jgi:hypothetical protein